MQQIVYEACLFIVSLDGNPDTINAMVSRLINPALAPYYRDFLHDNQSDHEIRTWIYVS